MEVRGLCEDGGGGSICSRTICFPGLGWLSMTQALSLGEVVMLQKERGTPQMFFLQHCATVKVPSEVFAVCFFALSDRCTPFMSQFVTLPLVFHLFSCLVFR